MNDQIIGLQDNRARQPNYQTIGRQATELLNNWPPDNLPGNRGRHLKYQTTGPSNKQGTK
jgi:hypothetical protein